MITYRRCTETNEDAIFEAFQTGFSDYMVKFELTNLKATVWNIP